MSKNWTTKDIPDQTGKFALVTGATAGLGYETALALAQAGATVIVGGRNEVKANGVLQKIRELYPSAKIDFGKVDQSSLAAVGQFAATTSAKYPCLDILVNNAGIGPPPTREVTPEGFEIVFATNHLSHFALTAHLLPLLQKSSSPRVVNVSSLAHRQGKINFEDLQSEKCSYGHYVYAQSKLANLLFTFELQRRSEAEGWGIMSNAAHPGLSRTEIVDKGQKSALLWFTKNILKPLASQSAAAGALPQIYAATALEAKGGEYYGPNGYFEMKGAVCPSYILPEAKDEALAVKLWDVSTQLTAVTWP